MNNKEKLALIGSLYLLSAGVLAFEVSLSRLLAATTGYHMAFLAVSLTILGLGAGGFVLYLLTRRQGKFKDSDLAVIAVNALPLSLLLFTVLMVKTPITETWVPFLLITLAPFLFAGVVLSYIFRRYAAQASILYAFDLLGAAMGCLIVILFLHLLEGGLRAVLAVAVLHSVAALIFTRFSSSRRVTLIPGITLMLSLILLGISYIPGKLELDPVRFHGMRDFLENAEKSDMGPRWQPELSYWDEFSRVDTISYTTSNPAFKHLFINGRTPANMIGFTGPNDSAFLRRLPGYAAFELGRNEHVCSIGAGGGVDVLAALTGGAKTIDAVEINPAVVRATLADEAFNGGVFRFDRVTLHVEDGRSFLARSDQNAFDVIYLAFVQSITGDFTDLAFVEDYLYTTEAAGLYFSRLADGGRLVMEIHNEALLHRFMATVAAMLQGRGIAKEEISLYLAAYAAPKDEKNWSYVTLLSKTPFTEAQTQKLLSWMEITGSKPIAIPGKLQSPVLTHFLQGEGSLAIGNLELSPCSDDKPFFFRHDKSYLDIILYAWLGVLAVNSLFAGLFWAARRHQETRQIPSLGVFVLYFMTLGVNYTLIQIVVTQKSILFLGYPTFSLSVVLLTMLLGSALGSYLSSRFQTELLARARTILLTIALVGVAYAFLLPAAYQLAMGVPLAMKLVLVAAFLLPISLLLGMPMPLGLRASATHYAHAVPFFWGLNGTASVLGSMTAMLVGMTRGFVAAWLVASLVTFSLVLVLGRSGKSE